MGKSILYRLFGLGKIPKAMRPILEAEGIVLLDEGLSCTTRFKNFRAPGKRYSSRVSWFTGSIVITQIRIAAFSSFRPIINIPLDHQRINELNCSVKKETTLCIQFDPAAFFENWSGSVEFRFSTDQARLFCKKLERS